MHRVRAHVATVLMVALACMTVFAVSASPAHARTWAVPKAKTVSVPTTLDEFEDQLMIAINKARRAKSLPRVAKFDECTDRMAERWGKHIASTGRFEHRDQREVLRKCRTSWAGETLIRGEDLTPKSMVEEWLNSPGHRDIILHRRAKLAGVSVTQDPQGRLVGVLNVTRRG